MEKEMGKRLSEKVAIVTGATSGIGRATAMVFAREGAHTVVAGRDPKRGEETVAEIKSKGGEAALILADLTAAMHVERMVKTTVEMYGRLDVLVNNAGIYAEGNVIEATETDWHRVLLVNLTGVFLCMKYAIPEMIKSGGGTIVNVSSEAGLVGIRNQAAYNVSKSGVIELTKSAAVDFADHNIRVNCLCPGRVLTPLVEEVIRDSGDPEKTRRVLSEDRPVKRMGRPEEIAAGILFLASDEAPYATGAVLAIDGGYTVP
jgi:NAD(P)-dependent dehydrogenase (short-subunit alcohol dehydrogenase family)